jgi:hypothetical protein
MQAKQIMTRCFRVISVSCIERWIPLLRLSRTLAAQAASGRSQPADRSNSPIWRIAIAQTPTITDNFTHKYKLLSARGPRVLVALIEKDC